MELIRISDRKLKIMLTPTDMRHFELNPDSFGENSRQMHHAFRLLLEEIKRQTDFDADDRQISVQYFPSREGGCEMFISRLQACEEDPPPAPLPTSIETRALQLRTGARTRGAFCRDCAYRFESIDHLLLVCRRLRDAGYIGESVAYRDEKSRYYLIIAVRSSSPFSIPEEWNFIVEYGSVENAALVKLYVMEHGNILCASGAVDTLAELA